MSEIIKKDRQRESSLKKKFGITLNEYNAILEEQGGVCAVCQEKCATGNNLAVDHDHVTGKIRGLLCFACNTSLGKFGDRVRVLNRAAWYVGKNRRSNIEYQFTPKKFAPGDYRYDPGNYGSVRCQLVTKNEKPDPNQLLVKAMSADIAINDGERSVVAKISTIAVDRDGEVLIPSGLYAKEFEQNPVVFLGHDYYTLPVGKCVAIKRTEDAVIAKTVFAERPENHPVDQEWIPDTLFSLYKQGVLKGFSVGFTPIESRPATDRDIQKFGANVRRVYSKWKLLEYSVAALPANQEAVATAVAKGWIPQKTADAIFTGEVLPEAAKPYRKVLPIQDVYVASRAKRDVVDEVARHAVQVEEKKLGRLYSRLPK